MIYNIITYNNDGVEDDVITFSIVKDMNEEYQGEVTEYPVETGSVISDHVKVKRPSIEVSGMVTEYSHLDRNNSIIWDGKKFTTMNEAYGIDHVDRHLTFKEKLKKIYFNKKPFTLIGVKDLYLTQSDNETSILSETLNSKAIEKFNNCILSNLKFPKEVGSRGSLSFSLSIKQVEFTEVKVDSIDKNAVKQVVPIKKGSADGESADTEIKEAQDSSKKDSERAWSGDEVRKSQENLDLEQRGQDIRVSTAEKLDSMNGVDVNDPRSATSEAKGFQYGVNDRASTQKEKAVEYNKRLQDSKNNMGLNKNVVEHGVDGLGD